MENGGSLSARWGEIIFPLLPSETRGAIRFSPPKHPLCRFGRVGDTIRWAISISSGNCPLCQGAWPSGNGRATDGNVFWRHQEVVSSLRGGNRIGQRRSLCCVRTVPWGWCGMAIVSHERWSVCGDAADRASEITGGGSRGVKGWELPPTGGMLPHRGMFFCSFTAQNVPCLRQGLAPGGMVVV
jgi:hypothetical protein